MSCRNRDGSAFVYIPAIDLFGIEAVVEASSDVYELGSEASAA